MRTPDINKHPILISEKAKEVAKELLQTLTLQEKIGQLFMPMIKLDEFKESEIEIKGLIEQYHIGGIMYYKGDAKILVKIFNAASKLTTIPLFFSIDGETGLATRLKDTIRFPQALTIGSIVDSHLIEEYGRVMARQCKRLGININFAPIIDVNSNPKNPVIGVRAFGNDRDNVVEKGLSYARGLESEGVLSVAKHFPGHGDSHIDSHKSLPLIDKNICQLEEQELFPFRKYIEAGFNGMMVAHLNVPALDKEDNSCSSLSKSIVSDLLRKKLKFKGLIFTDALTMGGVDNQEHIGLCALKAGNDIILLPRDIKKDFSDIEKAISEGAICESEVEEHCLRILEYKCAMCLNKEEIALENLANDLNNDEALALRDRLYKASITLIKKGRIELPVAQDCDLLSLGVDENLTFTSFGSNKVESRFFNRYVDGRFKGNFTYKSDTLELPQEIISNKSGILCVEIFSDKDRYAEAIKRLLYHPDLIIIFYIDCYKMEKFMKLLKGSTATIICAYEDAYWAQVYAQKALFDNDGFPGKLPINID